MMMKGRRWKGERRDGRELRVEEEEEDGDRSAAPATSRRGGIVDVVPEHDRVAASEHTIRLNLGFALDETCSDEEEEVLDACGESLGLAQPLTTARSHNSP